MAMTKRDHTPSGAPPAQRTRRARLHGLLFAGTALGTTILTLGAAASPKIPPWAGD
jgi:hypothetical protein